MLFRSWDGDKWLLIMSSFLIPLIFTVVFVLGPVFTRMNESRIVPERVT